jgi:S-adenosylmethionine hydrolase
VASLISLLTDFGTRDPWLAICKGVILSIAPDARLLDISHEIAPFDIREGALTLAAALPELPVGVHVAVVDPGVGTQRRALGLRTARGDLLVGPDNGLLGAAAAALGGVTAAHELRDPRYRRATVSHTFHGRDVFAPAAAYLATGVPLAQLGPLLRVDELVSLDLPRPDIVGGRLLQTGVLLVDAFGNVELAGNAGDVEGAIGPLRPGDRLVLEWWQPEGAAMRETAVWAETFGEVEPGAVLVHEDSLGRLAIAVSQGSAADQLGIGVGTVVNVLRAM